MLLWLFGGVWETGRRNGTKYQECAVMADLLENLNEKQREAVLETEGYVPAGKPLCLFGSGLWH